MRIYQFIFVHLGHGEIQTIYGTDFCDVNKRAYERYLVEWARQDADLPCFCNNNKFASLCDFCSYFNRNDSHMYGGFYGSDGGIDIVRNDIIINTEEVK